MAQNYNKTFNINVTHATPTPTPGEETSTLAVPKTADTGFDADTGVATTGGIILAVLVTLALGAGIALLLIHRRRHFAKGHKYLLGGVIMFALAFGLSVPTLVLFSHATGDDTTTLNIQATEDGAQATTTTTMTLNQDYPYGYTVTAYMQDSDNSLYTQDKSHKISATETATTLTEMTKDSWGIENQTTHQYLPISTDSANPTTIIDANEHGQTGTTLTLTYGANISTTTPVENYSGKIVYTITAKTVTTFDDAFAAAGKTKDPTTNLYKMQDMTSEICAAVSNPLDKTAATTQMTTLVDTRYGQEKYSVAKALDGKCWMTDNLRLGSDTYTINLTANDTDITANYTLPIHKYGWDFAERDVSNIYVDANNTATHKKEVYYNWIAATAGTGTSSSETQRTDASICPKGWTLPKKNSPQEISTDNDIYALYNAYTPAETWSEEYSFWVDPDLTLANAPISFTLPGVYYIYYGPTSAPIQGLGTQGAWWSNTTLVDEAYVGVMLSDSNIVSPWYQWMKLSGASVRCRAR